MEKSSAKIEEVITDAEAEEVFLDGGYGWVIVFATFMNSFIAEGISDSLSNFHVAFVEDFKVTRAKTSWVISTALGMSFIPGPFVGVLIEWLGSRTVTIAGSVTIFFGLFIGSYMQSIESLIFPVGIVGGIGLCLMTMPQLVIVSEYFHYRLGLAVGISVAGSAAGSIVLGGPVVDYLIRDYDWRYSMRITSYIALGGILFGSLLTPANFYFTINNLKTGSKRKVSQVPASVTQQSTITGADVSQTGELQTDVNPSKVNLVPTIKPSEGQLAKQASKEIVIGYKTAEKLGASEGLKQAGVNAQELRIKITKEKIKTDFMSCVRRIFNLNYVTNLGMFIYLAGNLFGNIGFYAPAILIKDRVMYDKVTDGQGASWLIAINALAEFLGRLATGFVANYIAKNFRSHVYATTTVLAGLLTICTAFSTDYLVMALYMFLFGFVSGTTTILEPIILQDLFSPDSLIGLYGMMLSLTGVGTIFGMPIIGKIHDVTGSYQGGYLMAGALVGFSGLLFYELRRASRLPDTPIILESDPAVVIKPKSSSSNRKSSHSPKIAGQVFKSSDVVSPATLGFGNRPATIKDSALFEVIAKTIPEDKPIIRRIVKRPRAIFKQFVTPATIVTGRLSPQSSTAEDASNEFSENHEAAKNTKDSAKSYKKTNNITGTPKLPRTEGNQ